MIGPHEGKELELMLAGEKKLAVFHDALPPDGAEIPEEIIPEKAFAPYVAEGAMTRIAEDIRAQKTGDTIRYVCFTLPGEEWRARTFLWMRRQTFSGRRPADKTDDIFTGRLLGYDESDIEKFISQF